MSTQMKRNVIIGVIAIVVIVVAVVLILTLNNDGSDPVASGNNQNEVQNQDSNNNSADNSSSNNSSNDAGPANSPQNNEPEPAPEPEPEPAADPEPADQPVQIDSLLDNPSFEEAGHAWVSRGSPAVEITTEEAHTGSHSLKTSGRTKTWEGPIIHVTDVLEEGKTYYVSVYLLYKGPSESQTFNLQFETDGPDGVGYPNVGSAEAKAGEWTLIEGEYTIPEGLSRYSIYIEVPWKPDEEITESDIVDFYIDDVVVREVN